MAVDMSAFSPGTVAARLLAVLHQSRVTRHHFSRDATIFQQGDAAKAIFLVETGRVRLTRVLADGTPLILYVAQAGEGFAEASLSAAHYHCDAIAEIDTVVLALPKADLLAAFAADPAECLALALTLAAQVRDLRARLELRNIRSASARVLTWLRLHSSGNPPSVRMQRSWTQVADELGLTREVVYRVLATLERQMQISRDGSVVRLTIAPDDSRHADRGSANK